MKDRSIAALRLKLAERPDGATAAIADLREEYDRAVEIFPLPDGVACEPGTLGGVPGEWLRPEGADPTRALLYFHGGGYVLGSTRSHRHMVAALAAGAGVHAFSADYRLAPEHPFPAAVEDGTAAWQGLLESGIDPACAVIGGDSAGGGLTVAALVKARDDGLAMPAGGLCISPWTDMTMEAGSYTTKAETDPMVKKPQISRWAGEYLGADTDRRHPWASPLYADLEGLPPLLVQVGSEEVLLDDSVSLAEAARRAGVEVQLSVADEMIHVWHWFDRLLDRAKEGIDEATAFIRACTGPS